MLLAAEGAAQHRTVVANPARGKAQRRRHVLIVLDGLGGYPDVHCASLVHPGDTALGLDKCVVDTGGEIGIFDDDIGLGETGLDVALIGTPVTEHHALDVLEGVGSRQGLIVDFDKPGRPLGKVVRLGSENRHGVAAEADRILGQDGIIGIAARVLAGYVLRRQDAVYARQCERSGRVDFFDFRGHRRRADHLADKLVREPQIVAVNRIAHRLGERVFFHWRVPDVGHLRHL